jgi:hypothetical protein
MSEQSFTAAILLGASSFPLHSETYGPNEAFLRSKQDFRAYLQDQNHGLALPDGAICDLFDLQHLPSQQLVAIGRFLEKITKQVDRGTLCNLIVYYVGHGYFAGLRQEYHVALACLEMGYDATTGLKVTELAEVLKERARSFRRFVILDCCFAAEALKEFQGAAEDAIYAKAKGAFSEDAPRRPLEVPRRGTALYCAADKDHVARSPKELPRTMFSDALLEVLRSGDQLYAPYLTLAQVQELAWERLQGYPNPVRPVLHSPDQTEGDIAAIVGLFPNLALRRPTEAPLQPAADIGSSAVETIHGEQGIRGDVFTASKHDSTERQLDGKRPADPPHDRAEPPQSVGSLQTLSPVAPERPFDPNAHSSPTGGPSKGLEDEVVARVLHQLTRLVGPIASILVNKARKQADDLDTFSRLIADRLEAKERRQFLEAIAVLQKNRPTPSPSRRSQ